MRPEAGLIQLLDPPFDRTAKDPGYIRGYVPGVRENGGQYTHAAVWAAMAFAHRGDASRAWELARMINPVNHALDASAAAIYKVEPYVLAADVYAVAPHVGRGGWTYSTPARPDGCTGCWWNRCWACAASASLALKPCLPADWPGYGMQYRFGDSVYRITVEQVDGMAGGLSVDGQAQPGFELALVDDGAIHQVHLRWPRSAT